MDDPARGAPPQRHDETRETRHRRDAQRLREVFARNFVRARQALGLTQAAVARLIGRTQQAVSHFESADDSLKLDTMVLLASAVQRSVPDLLTPPDAPAAAPPPDAPGAPAGGGTGTAPHRAGGR